MKLFVWNNPITLSLGGACLYVVAETEEQARSVAKTARWSKQGHEAGDPGWSNHGVERDDTIVGRDFALGAPDRVIEAPCAEIYYWQE